MRRRTEKFIEAQSGVKTSFLSRINSKVVLVVAGIIAAALVLGGLYIWYVRTYGGARKITIYEEENLPYEWLQITSGQGITGDYLWSRTSSLMISNSEDGVMIPSWYMIEGRLASEEAEESGIYALSDQALLLKIYVEQNDRVAASKLKSRVFDTIDIDEQPLVEQMMWLESFLMYYSAYGTTNDLSLVESLVASIFDSDGHMMVTGLVYTAYGEGQYESLAELDDTNSGTDSNGQNEVDFEGVPLASVRLRLIKSLEDNNFLPEGSYEYHLALVKGGFISSDVPFYAYAYRYEDDGSISYVNSHYVAMSVGISDSIRTMRNLAEVNELDNISYAWVKNYLMNGNVLRSTYYLTTGLVDGSELFDSYLDIMAIAFAKDDMDLFSVASAREAGRVATYTNSPALSMVYRTSGDRYMFYASENLSLILALM